MDIKIKLNDGTEFSAAGVNFDAALFASDVNQPGLSAVSFGGVVISKHALLSVEPQAVPETPDVTLHTNDGRAIPIAAAGYDAAVVLEAFNNQKSVVLHVGDVVISKNMVKMIVPVTQ